MKCTLLIAVVLVFSFSCSQKKNRDLREGYINVTGGKIWYRIVGSGNKTPVLLLHGGPGVPSYYLNPLAELSQDRPVIFYDQLGCGRSEKINDTSLMTTERYVEELKQLTSALNIKEFYLYGQSWGTMLGLDYYLKYPEGIKALVLSSPAISIPFWLRDADTLISTLPDSIQNSIRINEEQKTFDSPEYQRAIKFYYERFLARKLPWSPDIDSAFSRMGENVYKYMGGPSEFTMIGPLKDYDRTNRLSEVKVPTLFITGEYDEARPSTVRYYASLVKNSAFKIIKNAGHLTMQDNPEHNNLVLMDFFKSLEK